jgi:hypothetical protein
MPSRVGRPALAIGAIALAGVIAMPALAQELSPSPSDQPSASASPAASASESASASPEATSAGASAPSLEPGATAETATPTPVAPSTAPAPAATGGSGDDDESAETEKTEAPPITLTGVVGVEADVKHPHYTLTVGSLVYQLETGPWWFWGDAHPLAPFVGKAVTIRGEAQGTDAIEVFSANGTTLREPGKPPWAGGPFVVGEKHPGWKPWMADGKPGKGPKTADPTP